jgi:DNA-binding SARP family transcriptional activator/tetratricopeptide (TPR) repeat protein
VNLEFSLLGPLQVRRCGEVVPVPGNAQRTLLAALLLNADRILPIDELAEALWGDRTVPSARASVQTYLMRLRKTLGDSRHELISTAPPGYSINIGIGDLDIYLFEGFLEAARAGARGGSWETAAGQARAALDLYRGAPLADVESAMLTTREVPRLIELRLRAAEVWIDAEMHLGHHDDVIAELECLTAANPLREHLHAMLVLALYRAGRQAEALAAYRHARQHLVDELGTEPGAELRELHQRVLTGDSALAVLPMVESLGTVFPRELPAPVQHFVGRDAELVTLSRMLDEGHTTRPGAVVISAIDGSPGVGKTALAVYWAHQVANRFPDGQLYVDLHGYDPGQPIPATDVLAGFLRALGVPSQHIPPGLDERAARYRSLLAGRRMLVVLDNASGVEQVRPLLPGAPECVAVVTSRDSLAGLVARYGAVHLDVGLLLQKQAVDLLRVLIGSRVVDDPDAAEMLAEQCCRLPLALRIAAEFAIAHPEFELARLANELADEQQRLDLLETCGDSHSAVRAAFSWSYQHLDADSSRMFRLVALHPGPDLDRYACAALNGTTVKHAARLLELLARAHLMHPTKQDHYSMHDLLRTYARELTTAQDSEQDRRAALTRQFDSYLHTAAKAMDALFPAEAHRRPRVPVPTTSTPSLPSPDVARTWLDGERANLVAVMQAAVQSCPTRTIDLAATLFRYLDAAGHYAEATVIHTCARQAAQQVGDRTAEAIALTNLGAVDLRQGRYKRAGRHIQQALTIYRETGDRSGQARALGNLGIANERLGHYEQASSHIQQALSLYRETGDRSGQASALGNLALIHLLFGRNQQAISHLQQSLALCRETGDRYGEVRAHTNLGNAEYRSGDYQQAVDHIEQALSLSRKLGDRTGEADALISLGDVELQQAHHRQATRHLQQALALYHEIGDRAGQAQALNSLGKIFLATGQLHHARTHHAIALGLADQIGDQQQQARAHNGLACTCQAACDQDRARYHWQEALSLYDSLGAPEADRVRAELGTACGA